MSLITLITATCFDSLGMLGWLSKFFTTYNLHCAHISNCHCIEKKKGYVTFPKPIPLKCAAFMKDLLWSSSTTHCKTKWNYWMNSHHHWIRLWSLSLRLSSTPFTSLRNRKGCSVLFLGLGGERDWQMTALDYEVGGHSLATPLLRSLSLSLCTV